MTHTNAEDFPMDISSWHRETSLLALSLSIDSALRDDKDFKPPKSGTRKRTVLGRHSSVQPARGLLPHPTRKRVLAAETLCIR